MTALDRTEAALAAAPKTWLVTGAAGFIGSHLTERLIGLGQAVTALDDFSTGHRRNLDAALALGQAAAAAAGRAPGTLRTVEGDIRDPAACADACTGASAVLHQAALGSVPRSIADPWTTHTVNADGFVRVLLAARDAGVRRVVYASSSSVYGDEPTLPKVEGRTGTPLSPYAVTKKTNELYADTVARHYGMEVVGLRYFNVFGPRQDPAGAYAAVMPRWIDALLDGRDCTLFGDGSTSRDFCYVANVVQANLLAATAPAAAATGVYNVAVGDRTTLVQLHHAIRAALAEADPGLAERPDGLRPPMFAPERAGDIRHSLADVTRAREHLGYCPTHDVHAGLAESIRWYVADARALRPASV